MTTETSARTGLPRPQGFLTKKHEAALKFLAALACATGVFFGSAWATELSDKLQGGTHLLLMRHAEAPGIGDPPDLSLTDCSSQRNLDTRGRNQAKRIGDWLKSQGVSLARVYSSPWCRCTETAALLDLGAVEVQPALGSFFNQAQNANNSTAALQALVARTLPNSNSQALILVTHQVNIRDYVGVTVDSGEMVLAHVDRLGRVLSWQRYRSP